MKLVFLRLFRWSLLKRQRKKLIVFILLILILTFRWIGLTVVGWLFQIPQILTADEIGLSKCPACFGVNSSLCTSILDGEITVRINGFWTNEYTKGVLYGRWRDKEVVVKYLASNREILEFERNVCKSAGMRPSCDLRANVWSSFLNEEGSVKKMLQKSIECPSQRLLQNIIEAYGKSNDSLGGEEKLYLSTGLHVNHEVILLQIFPKEDGWPFPKFYGSCGSVIVVENGGNNLKSFQNKPWPIRAKIALNLIELAHKLTSGKLEDWVLYFDDASAENFGVNERGEVVLLDIEHIVVLDLRQTVKEVDGNICIDTCSSNDPECLQYSPSELCHGSCRDHNWYALCRGVLADMQGRDGLLHSAPIERQLKIKLNRLLQDCVSGQNGRREDEILKIANILKNQIFVN